MTLAAGARMDAFAALVRRWNATHGLVSRGDLCQLEGRHIRDSLALLPWLRGTTLVDIGAGAGFPGIPLALARPGLAVTLLERSARKARFLRQAVMELKLGNATVAQTDANTFRAEAPFDSATIRAVAAPEAAWRLARPLLRRGGAALLQTSEPLPAARFPRGHRVASASAMAPSGRRCITVVAAC